MCWRNHHYGVAAVIIAFSLTGEFMEERAGACRRLVWCREARQHNAAPYCRRSNALTTAAELFVPAYWDLSADILYLDVLWRHRYAFTRPCCPLFRIGGACPLCIGTGYSYGFGGGINKAAKPSYSDKGCFRTGTDAQVNVVVLDTSGLTEGHPTVIGWLWAQGQEEHYKDVLLAAESTSDHPLAEAIVTALEGEEQVIPAHLDGFENITEKVVRVASSGCGILGRKP